MDQAITIHSEDTGFIYAVLKLSFSKQYKYSVFILFASVVQLQARGPHVAHRSGFSGPQKHFEKIFKAEILEKRVRLQLSH